MRATETLKMMLGNEHPDTDQHGQSSDHVQKSRPMEGGRGAGPVSDGDEGESAWRGASYHVDQHSQSNVNVQEARPMNGGRGARRASDGDLQEGAWRRASRHAN